MKKFPIKAMSMTALAAVASAAVVAPAVSADEHEVNYNVDEVVFNIDGENVVVSLLDYAENIGQGTELDEFLAGNQPTHVRSAGKFFSLTRYATAFGLGDRSQQDIFEEIEEDAEEVPARKTVSFEDGAPVLTPVEEEAEVTIENLAVDVDINTATVTADVDGAEEATVSITPDEDLTEEDIAAHAESLDVTVEELVATLEQDVEVEDGSIEAVFENLPVGTHTATVDADGVTESVEFTVESTELVIESVEGLTTQVFRGEETQLEFAINGQEEAADLEEIEEAGFDVKFLTSLDDETDGLITTSRNFEYQVVIEKDEEVVAESDMVSVNAVAADTVVSILDHQIKLGNKVVNTVAVGDTGATIEITEFLQLNGEEVEGSVADVKFESSNTNVLVVNEDTGRLTPLRAGTAVISISKDGMETYEIPVTVEADAREVSSVNEPSFQLTAEDDKRTVELVVTDQYGDPVEGQELNFEFDEDDTKVIEDLAAVTTDAEGKVEFDLQALADAEAGTNVIDIKAGSKKLGEMTVEFVEAGEIVTRTLRNTGTSSELDLDDIENGVYPSLTLQFVGLDDAGVVNTIYNLEDANSPYTVSSSDEDVVTVDPDGGNIVVTAEGVGTATITLREGSFVRSTYEVSVVDTSKPEITVLEVGGTNVTADLDEEENKFVYEYVEGDKDRVIDGIDVTFSQAAQLDELKVDGEEISGELLALLLENTNPNFLSTFNTTFSLSTGGTTLEDILEVGSEFEVTVKNRSGNTNTFTIEFKDVTPAE